MRWSWKAAVAGLGILAAVAGSSPAAERSAAADEAEIRAALARWVEAANSQDWKTALEVWAPDVVGWYPGQPDDSFAREQANAARPKRDHPSRFELTIDEVLVSCDMAVVRDTWTMRSSDPAHPQVTTFRSFEVWRRQPAGAWKIARWISGPDPAAK